MTDQRYVFPALGTLYERVADFAWPIVRGITGYFFIPHGAQKLFGWFGGGGLAQSAQGMARQGLEPAMFWASYIGCLEFFGGILLVLGLFTRPVAALFAGFMFVATVHANLPNGYWWLKGGIEVPLLLTVLSLAIAIRGGGPYSLDRFFGREI